MLHLSTKNLQRYEFPPEVEGGDPPLVALYAVASMTQLAVVGHDMRQTGVKPVPMSTIRKHLRDYLQTLEADADRARVLHILDAYDRGTKPDQPEGWASNPDGDAEAAAVEKQALADAVLVNMAATNAEAEWEPYRRAQADATLHRQIRAVCYVRRLLRGVEGPDADAIAFSAPHGIVDDGTLKRLGFTRLVMIGDAIAAAANISEIAAKN